ncbi:hypothetical protein [Arthrobacter sp. ES3-54]|uniref:hypothetical protein n=1 Tax=Arthrobacter sp. ES3-54 TaxID=1502991 RepID=UPI00240628BF|nr:hypothetical protein [Arthrobacter sp. ES3-54]MDF9752926.1 hypothetical protein [Arthrobacter sp. ES3-54]
MTGTREPQQDGSIQAMLSDSGLAAATELRSALEQLRAVVPDAAPAPRADLAALLAAGAVGPAPVLATTTALPTVASAKYAADESLPTRVASLAECRRRKRRLAIVGGAVVGAMTLGAGAVAASSEDFRHSVSETVDVIFQPAGPGTPAPEHVQPSTSPSSVPALPAPARTSGPGTPGAASTDEGTPNSSGTPGSTETGHTPPAVGRGGILPTPGKRPESPGLPGGGRNGDKDLPRVPGSIIPTLPGVVPTKAPGQP